nr:hypothetical protein [Tanacetum cinerariifolium]
MFDMGSPSGPSQNASNVDSNPKTSLVPIGPSQGGEDATIPSPKSVKENQEKDKIGSKPDKNEKRGKAGKSLKQLQWTMNYQPITAGNQSTPSADVQEQFDAEKAGEEIVQQYVFFPIWSSGSTNPQNTDGYAAF